MVSEEQNWVERENTHCQIWFRIPRRDGMLTGQQRPNKVCIFITKLPEETIGYTVIYHEYKRLCECDTKFFFDLIAECFESCSSFN